MTHPIDVAREIARLRQDLAKLATIRDEQPKRYARHADQYDRWRGKLEERIKALEGEEAAHA